MKLRKIHNRLRSFVCNYIKNDRHDGFTMMEMVIVLAIMAILMLLVSVGLEGYNNAADRIERNEVAESSYYAVQSYLATEKRQGELEEFTDSVKIYNLSTYGDEMVLTNAQNRVVIESNYEGSDFDNYYTNDYEVQHQKSEFVCMRLDAGDDEARKSNPLYSILFAALKDQDVMEHSFLVEFDSQSGIVRSVFYSKNADSLDYHFLQEEGSRQENETDVIDRNTASLDKKRQGYCGVLETNGYRDNFALAEPQNFMLVNNDRLYLTWDEANAAEPDFMNGTYSLDNLIYEITLYDKDGNIIAIYELPRRDLDKDLTGTKAGILNHIDDMGATIDDESGTMVTRAGYADLTLEEAEDGIAGEKYYVLLECLDHTFEENGYDFSGDDEIYATLSLYYQEDVVNAERKVGFDETVVSNVESVYYADVEEDGTDKEYTIAYSRHLWNVRNGYYDGDYRLVADIDWSDIEERARDISFTSTIFEDEDVLGLTHGFAGSFSGKKETAGGVAEVYRNAANYEIKGINIYEETNIQVGLFAFNQGTVSDVILNDFSVEGARHVGTVAGDNEGTIQNVCVLNSEVTGSSELGGILGVNKGSVTDSAVACTVAVTVPAGTDKISTGTIGRYVGGAVGYQTAGTTLQNITSGVVVDENTGMAMVEDWEGKGGSAYVSAKRSISDVTGIRAVGGIVGEIADGAGEFTNLYNYAKLNATYVDMAERTARSDTDSYMYQFFGGIVGRVYTSNTLKNCNNYTVVELGFKENGSVCDEDEIYDYIMTVADDGIYYNNPRYVGGIAGYNIGSIVDCASKYTGYGTLEEELTAYQKVVDREEGLYIGTVVGGIAGMNAGTVLYTDTFEDGMSVVVKGTKTVGGLVGQAISGSIQNNSAELKLDGVVTAHLEHAGGVVAYASGGTIGGVYTNNGYVMGENAGGIAGFLNTEITLADCNNTGVIYGRGNATTTRGYVGGVIGYNKGTVTNCTNTGTVSITNLMDEIPDTAPEVDGTYADIGGVVGYNTGNVVDCHSKLNAEGSNYIVGNNSCYTGGLVGRNTYNGTDRLGIIQTSTMETVDIPIIIGAIKQSAANMKTGGIVGVADGTLTLQNFCYDGDINVKVAINTTHVGTGGIMGGLANSQKIAGCIFSGKVVSNSAGTGGMVGHMSGGVITGTNVVSEQATIEGNYYTGGIVGFHIVESTESAVEIMETRAQVTGKYDVGGFIGRVRYSFSFSLSNRKNYGHIIGGKYAGGIVGAYGISKAVDAVDVQNFGQVEGYEAVGGLIGRVTTDDLEIEYTFNKLSNEGKVNGNVSGSTAIGGVIGHNEAVIRLVECENKGSVAPKDADCSIYNAGGIIGREAKTAAVISCKNYGTITGDTTIAGIIGYADAQGTKVVLEDCINLESAQIIATVSTASGLVGRCDGSEANNRVLTMTDCINYAQVDSPRQIGGMVGYGLYSVLQIEDCHNYGGIGAYSVDKWTIVDAGGIAGRLGGSASMEEGFIRNSTQNTNIYAVGTAGETGGIVGKSESPLLVENCSFGTETQNYSIYLDTGARRIGGIVGYSSETLRINNCISHADVSGKGRVYETGGIVGAADATLTIGENGNTATYSKAYGDIDSTGKIHDTGGIVGFVNVADYSIYGVTNYGNIGASSSEVTYVGGIVGNSKLGTYEEEAFGIMDNCTQLGQIYQASNHVGGMLGQNDFYSTTITNCQNGLADVADSGKIHVTVAKTPGLIGGLVGTCNGKDAADTFTRNLNIQASNNYGEIYIATGEETAQYIGGLVGDTTHNLTIGTNGDDTLACANYGRIYGQTGSKANCVGGILGMGESEYKEYLYTQIYSATNHASIGENMTLVTNVGGIAGYAEQLTILVECTNLGKLTALADDTAESMGSGGLVGYIAGVEAVLMNCTNGSSSSAEVASLETVGSAQELGGLVGGAGTDQGETAVGFVNCVNYANIIVNGAAEHIGGFMGRQYANNAAIFQSSYNYGDIIAKGANVNYVGGFLGRSEGMQTIFGYPLSDLSTDTSKININYGDLRFEEGSTGRFVGGMVGYAKNTTFYGGLNEGNIIPDDTGSYVSVVGGIAGWLEGTTLMQDVTQLGNMKHVVFDGLQITAGGIVGILEGTATVTNTNNGSAENKEAGTEAGYIRVDVNANGDKPEMVGGIIGRNSATLNMTKCNNYGTIESSYTIYDVGGIIGRSEGSTTIGT